MGRRGERLRAARSVSLLGGRALPIAGGAISLELVELSPTLGVELRGVDLGRPLSEAPLREIRAAWNSHHLLLFRGRHLTSDDQLRFIRHFGEPVCETLDGSPFSYVSNVREDAIVRGGALFFHSDLAFTPDPLRAISLFAVEAPEGVAPTSFINAIRGCETLPEALALRVEGLPEGESRALLEELLEHLYRPEHIYQHCWQPGDFIFWDNWALQHARPEVSVNRTLRRVATGECVIAVPVAT